MKSKEEIAYIKADAKSRLDQVLDNIVALAEDIVPLYDVIEDYFFQDIDYHKISPMLPLWMSDAGHSPESPIDKDTYEKMRGVYNDPMSNRIIHWADVQAVLAAFQDRIMAVYTFLMEIYKYLPAYCLFDDTDYESSTRGLDDTSDHVYISINNVFVSLCSSFDLFTKVIYECYHYDINSFVEYKKMKSRKENILYRKGNYCFDELKADGLLYSEPVCIRTACSFRDEFIHNGSWDYRCSIYFPIYNGNPVEPFVIMPDIEDNGLLVTSSSRNRFYAKSNKINVFLPGFVEDVLTVLSKTIEALKNVLVKTTVPFPPIKRDKNTSDFIHVLFTNMNSLE